jgi:hypothetical protein
MVATKIPMPEISLNAGLFFRKLPSEGVMYPQRCFKGPHTRLINNAQLGHAEIHFHANLRIGVFLDVDTALL